MNRGIRQHEERRVDRRRRLRGDLRYVGKYPGKSPGKKCSCEMCGHVRENNGPTRAERIAALDPLWWLAEPLFHPRELCDCAHCYGSLRGVPDDAPAPRTLAHRPFAALRAA